MKILSVKEETFEEPVPVYDVIDVEPYHNFEIVTNSQRYVFSHNSVLERINSRFIVRGRVEGKLFLVSSKKSESDFIESYINRQKGKKGIYIVDSKIWEVKPEGTYSGEKFLVASGGVTKKPLIISDEETTWEVTLDSGEVKEYHLGDIVKLTNGREKPIEKLKVGDNIIE